MHYYDFNIADYRKDTGHLTPIEHYIYRTLMDWCYLDEEGIPKETQLVLRRLALGKNEEQNLLNVLHDFFKEGENAWYQLRIDDAINHYKEKAITNKKNGKKGGRPKKSTTYDSEAKPKKTQSVNFANQSESESNPNQEPITKNHKPNTHSNDGDNVEPTKAGIVCKKLHEMQVQGVNPAHPKLLALLEAGVELNEFVNMANTLPQQKLKFAYLLGAVEGSRRDAANMNKEGLKKKERPWYITNSKIIKAAESLGIKDDGGFVALKAKVYKHHGITSEMVKKARDEFDGEK